MNSEISLVDKLLETEPTFKQLMKKYPPGNRFHRLVRLLSDGLEFEGVFTWGTAQIFANIGEVAQEDLEPMGLEAEILEDSVWKFVRELNRKMTAALEVEYEYQTSDEAVIESLNANDLRFSPETGQGEDIFALSELTDAVRIKVIRRLTSLIGKPEEELIRQLGDKKVFTRQGFYVGEDTYVPIDQLPDDVKRKVLEKHRDFNVSEDWWQNDIIERAQELLIAFGAYDFEIKDVGGRQSITGKFDVKKAVYFFDDPAYAAKRMKEEWG